MSHTKNRVFSLSNLKFNKIVKILTYSDSFVWGGYYMMNALVAVYLKDKLEIDPLQVISFGMSVDLVTRSIFQIPIAELLDSHKTYIDEVWAMFLSSIVMAASIFAYQFITKDWHLYLIQFAFGFGVAVNMPAWRKTFARFIDRGHEGVEYSIYDVITNLSVAFLISAGGFIVSRTDSFPLLFNIASLLTLIGGAVALFLLKDKKMMVKN